MPAPEEPREEKTGLLNRLRKRLSRSADSISSGIANILTKRKLDEAALAELEDLLIQADIGVETATSLCEALARTRFGKEVDADEIRNALADEIERVLKPVQAPFMTHSDTKPHVVLIVGVNGTGKTTTIGKLTAQLRTQGKTVMLAAGDTFRAAAIEQLRIWGERADAKVIATREGGDAASLAYDALEQAKSAGTDVLLIDSAGRLHNKAHLMDELRKIIRVLRKLDESAPHQVLLVLDATTGQNAINQVDAFRKVADVTGLIMTKLDGTAKGGILVALAARFGLPIHAIGVGEGIDDLQHFDAHNFAHALTATAS